MNALSDLDLTKKYTYADYLLWKFDERVELIRGRVFKMRPAPNSDHQGISANIHRAFLNFLWGKVCKAYSAPYDVCLIRDSSSEKKITNVVQPDICVICDPTKINKKRSCVGAPDIVIEILSPGNNQKELKLKYDLYEEFGVKEYWIVYPDEQSLLRHILSDNGKFVPQRTLTTGDKLTTFVLPGFELTIDDVFFNLL
jgi:Uma2 family endonuclease